MNFAIVTGVSQGLGEAIAKEFLKHNVNVLGISRSGNEKINDLADTNNLIYKHIPLDLSDVDKLEKEIEVLIVELFEEDISKIYLVNNAGVLDPIDQAMNIASKDLIYHVNVNLIAPMIIMNSLLKASTINETSLIGLSITSGAAERAVYGWSAYCSTKASLNRYTETAALEQEENNTGHKVIAFSPGVMDTNMQEKIRSTKEDAFKEVAKFIEYKNTNKLVSPIKVGEIVVDLLLKDTEIVNGEIYNVKDYI